MPVTGSNVLRALSTGIRALTNWRLGGDPLLVVAHARQLSLDDAAVPKRLAGRGPLSKRPTAASETDVACRPLSDQTESRFPRDGPDSGTLSRRRRSSAAWSVRGHFFRSNRDIARSASSFPPVWQVAQ